MKKIVTGCCLFSLIVLVTLYSCSKNDTYWDSASSQSNTLSVSDAKSWYENQFAGDIADIISVAGSSKTRLVSYARGVFAGVPDWSHYQKYRNNANAMTVQLDYPDTCRGYRGFRDLVIVKNNKKQTFNAYVQLEIFSKSYLKKLLKIKGNLPDIRSYSDPVTFTGDVLLFSVNNEFIRGARYQNGKVVARIFPKNGISGMVKSISNSMHASKTYVAFNGGASVATLEGENASKSVAFNKSSQSLSYEEPSVRTASSASEDSNDSNDSNDTDTWDGTDGDLGDVTVISTKPNTNNDSDGFDSDDSYPTGSDPTPTNPSTGGGGGGGGSSLSFNTSNLVNTLGSKPTKEYSDKCTGLADIWNSYPNNEVFGYVTTDNQFIATDILNYTGGSASGSYKYTNGSGTTTYYYVYPDSQGAPSGTYSGMVHSGTHYFIPIKASVHTHSPCRTDGTNGVSQDVGDEDISFANNTPGISHWVIGCGAVAQFKGDNSSFFNIHYGNISTTCSTIQ